jgi:NADP-dependent 3-hydroxy acid dehydrogenase YdfG
MKLDGKLQNKVAIVTGSTSGIGETTAYLFDLLEKAAIQYCLQLKDATIQKLDGGT